MTPSRSRTRWSLIACVMGLLALALIAPRQQSSTAEPVSVMMPQERAKPPATPRTEAPKPTAVRRELPRAAPQALRPESSVVMPIAAMDDGAEAAFEAVPQPPEPSRAEAASEPPVRSLRAETNPGPAPVESVAVLPKRTATPLADASPAGVKASDLFAERRPTALLEQIEVLAAAPSTSEWGRAVLRRVEVLTQRPLGGDQVARQMLVELRKLATDADALAARARDAASASEIHRAQYALTRRLDIWEQAYLKPFAVQAAPPDPRRLAQQIAQLEAADQASRGGQPLRDFLQLEALRNGAGRKTADAAAEHRALARRVLGRIAQVKVSNGPRRATEEKALAALKDELRHWAVEPTAPEQVLAELERFERAGRQYEGHALADSVRQIALSPDPAAQELARRIDSHYRNANLRVAVSEPFLNRFMPTQSPTTEAVNDVIAGAPVSGQSTTLTKLNVKLVPDPTSLRLNLEAIGTVNSETSSASGPARFRSAGESSFAAHKTVLVGLDGVHLENAKADADANSHLRSVKTNYDGVPLVGALVRGIAKSQYDQKRGEAQVEVESKVAARAQARLDAEAEKRLAEAQKEFERRIVAPLKKLELNPHAMSLATTEQRLVMRLRLSSDEQLAAYTPRPQAPADAWASVQIHQSAINNALDQLHLAGRTFSAIELQRHLAERLEMPRIMTLRDDLPDDVSITFAARDPVLISCDDGKLTLTIAIAELSTDKSLFQNFSAKITYRPEPSGLHAGLARESTMELIGERLNTRSQVALRGLLAKLFPRERRLQLLPEDWASDPRLRDLAISQFVIEDGWIGVAVSPVRTAARPVTAPTKDPRG